MFNRQLQWDMLDWISMRQWLQIFSQWHQPNNWLNTAKNKSVQRNSQSQTTRPWWPTRRLRTIVKNQQPLRSYKPSIWSQIEFCKIFSTTKVAESIARHHQFFQKCLISQTSAQQTSSLEARLLAYDRKSSTCSIQSETLTSSLKRQGKYSAYALVAALSPPKAWTGQERTLQEAVLLLTAIWCSSCS